MLESEPQMHPNSKSDTPKRAFEVWKTLKPLSIEEVYVKSNVDFEAQSEFISFQKVDQDKSNSIGFHKIKNKQKHGLVREIYDYGEIQEGMFVDDKFNGYARILFTNGNIYIGMLRNHKPNGLGKITYANGKTDEGIWKDGKFQGRE